MLNIQYLPYRQIESMGRKERVNTILSIIRSGRIALIDGRLQTMDEAALIRETMDAINEEFNGIEIGVLHDNKRHGIMSRLKHGISKMLIGDRTGITIIGPAKIISELRQHPENLEMHFSREYLEEHYINAKNRKYHDDEEQ